MKVSDILNRLWRNTATSRACPPGIRPPGLRPTGLSPLSGENKLYRPPGPEGRDLKRSKTMAAIAGLIAVLCAESHALADDIEATCDTIAPGQATLHVRVSGMRSGNGNVTITIYPDDAAHFLDGKFKLARQKVPVTLPVTTACFALPSPSAYAVALFHDENDDGHLNTG